MSTHAVLSPSGSERWLSCPGSVALEAECPGETNEYADEGTAAHALAAMCFQSGNDPAAYEGRIMPIINGVYWNGDKTALPPKLKGLTKDINHTFTVNEEMIVAVRTYIATVKAMANGGRIYTEQRVPISQITREEGAEGTSDNIVVSMDEQEIQVHDLKYGMGVKIFAERNTQGMMYAHGAIKLHDSGDLTGETNTRRVRIVIHQPRLDHVDEWLCSVEELNAWVFNDAIPKAKHAMIVLKSGATSSDLHASDAACKFCKAKATCPELKRFVEERVGADFQDLTSVSKVTDDLRNAPVTLLAQKMAAVDLVEDWCKAVRSHVDVLLKEGIKVPGWKLVAGKRSARVWLDENVVIIALKKMRLKIEEIYSMKVISPTAAEKFFKTEPKRWATISALIAPQTPGQPHVAPTSDKRPEYVAPDATQDFSDNTGSDLV